MLATPAYHEAFRREAAALTTAAARGIDAPVPSCPGWTVATLVGHLAGQVYAPRIALLRALPADPAIERYEDLGLPPRFEGWFEALNAGRTDLAPPDGLLHLFEQSAADLGSLLYALPPETPIRTWWPPQQTASFLQRRMALETAIHRWDAQLAHGTPEGSEPELAADGIDETLEIMVPARRGWAESPRPGAGETYHFHRTDGQGEWLLRFDPTGVALSREHARGDLALRGSASDLFLWLWQRVPATRLEVFGDPALLDRYFELAPPD